MRNLRPSTASTLLAYPPNQQQQQQPRSRCTARPVVCLVVAIAASMLLLGSIALGWDSASTTTAASTFARSPTRVWPPSSPVRTAFEHDPDATAPRPPSPITGSLLFPKSDVVDAMFDGSNVTLTTFWGAKRHANETFYHGRAAPSLDWVVVFLASWYHRVCLGNGATADDGAAPVHGIPPASPCSGRMVFFCDATTAVSLVQRLLVIRQGRYFDWLIGSRVLYLVVVEDPSTPNAHTIDGMLHEGGAAVAAQLTKQVVLASRPVYMDEDWVRLVPNGANNFRFAFYRDWLTEYQQRRRRGGTRRRTTRVLIADNTDVAFQTNVFESNGPNGCFGWSASANGSAAGGAQRRTETHGGGRAVADTPHHGDEEDNDDVPWVTFTLEDASKTFRNEKYNRRWVGCYGPRVLREMTTHRRRVSCAGVTAGNAAGVLQYATAQVRELSTPALVECAAHVIHATLDQASHNVLLHRWLQWTEQHSLVGGGSAVLAGAPSIAGAKQALWDRVVAASASRRVGIDGPPPPPRFMIAVAAPNAVAVGDDGPLAAAAPCAFHGNFGRPIFGGAPQQEDGLVAVATGGGAPPFALFAVVHQYTSNRIPQMMQLMQQRYL